MFKLTNVQGATRMSGGIPLCTLPAGYLGSSFLGACMIACGFDTNASKIATLVIAAIFILALFWARREVLLVIPVSFMSTTEEQLQGLGSHSELRWLDPRLLVHQRVRRLTISRALYGCHELHVW